MSKLIKLNEPVTLPSGKKLEEITITDAINQCGCLRGLKFFEVVGGDMNALFTLISRVTSPTLSEVEASQLPLPAFTQLAVEIVGFFETSSPDKAAPKTAI